MTTTKSILQRAHSLLNSESWIQCDWAQNSFGEETMPAADDAVRWCLIGAVKRAQSELGAPKEDYHHALMTLSKFTATTDADTVQDASRALIAYNDGQASSYWQVRLVLEAAIILADA